MSHCLGFTATLEAEFSPPYWTMISSTTQISLPSIEVPKVNSTNLSSTWQESLPGLPDGGKVSVEIQFTQAQYETLLGKIGHVYAWRIETPDDEATECTFSAFISKLDVDFSSDAAKLSMLKMELVVTGVVAAS